MSVQVPPSRESSSTPKSGTNRHTRKPSMDSAIGDGMEDKLLHKVDKFLYRLESSLDAIEEYGAQKMNQMDENIKHAYQGLRRVRQEAIGEGKKRTEALLRVLEEHYNDAWEPVYDGEAEGTVAAVATGNSQNRDRSRMYRRGPTPSRKKSHKKTTINSSRNSSNEDVSTLVYTSDTDDCTVFSLDRDASCDESANEDGDSDNDNDSKTRSGEVDSEYNAGLVTDDEDMYDLQDYLNERLADGISFLEEKLEHLEHKCADFFDDTTETLAQAIAFALQAASSRLLTYDELPQPWKENPYITRGYRFCRNYADCMYSVVGVHNETCNIWSHLMGFFCMVGLSFYHLPNTMSWQEASTMDRAVMITFLLAAMKCLVCSSVWHTFSGISVLHAKNRFACFDYSGITVLIAASILTTEYTALYCNSVARAVYMTVTAASGLGGVMYTWHPSFDRPENRTKRISFFVGFAIAGACGFIHTSLLHGFKPSFLFYLPVFKSLFAYSCGVVVYALLIPERWLKGTIINYVGTSHNLWHVCVFLGIYYHYIATVQLLERAKHFSCGALHV